MTQTGRSRAEHETLLRELDAMPGYLLARLSELSPRDAVARGPEESFSPVEQCWHLADLEREGYGERIRRLLQEADPVLPDFDGVRIAQERNYQQLSLLAGLAAFATARRANLELLRRVQPSQWLRTGTQEGVGRISLSDLPVQMAGHDAAHRQEIEAWIAAARTRSGQGRKP